MNPGQSWRYRKARLRHILEIVGDSEEAEGIALDQYLSKQPKSAGWIIDGFAGQCLTAHLR